MTAVIRFLDRLDDGGFDTNGRAEANCPECGTLIRASGYFNACRNALASHLSTTHARPCPLLPTTGFVVST